MWGFYLMIASTHHPTSFSWLPPWSNALLVLMANSYPAIIISVCWLLINDYVTQPNAACVCGNGLCCWVQHRHLWPQGSLRPVKALPCQDAGWQTLPSVLHWNGLPLSLCLSFSLEFMQLWVCATHIQYSHTCMLWHWQELLLNCLGLCCFCVFSWQLKHIACINCPVGMDTLI